MPTLDTRDETEFGASIVILLKFIELGETTRFFALSPESYDYDGDTYEPVEARISQIQTSSNMTRDAYTVTFLSTNDFARGLIYRTHGGTARCYVYKSYAPTVGNPLSNTYLIASSFITGVETSDSEINVLLGDFEVMRRTGLRKRYTYECNVPFLSDQCGVDPDSVKINDTITSIGFSRQLFLATGVGIEYQGGMVKWGGRYQMITDVSPLTSVNVVRIWDQLEDNLPASVEIYPNCRRTREACNSYGNIDGFRGFPRKPRQSQFKNRIVYRSK